MSAKRRIIRAIDIAPLVQHGGGGSGNDVVEQTAPPAAPRPDAPDNLTTSAILDWSNRAATCIVSAEWDQPPGTPPQDYAVQWSRSSSFSPAAGGIVVQANSASIAGLEPNTAYYVRVAARYRAAQSDWNDYDGTEGRSKITTPQDTTPPSTPGLSVAWTTAGEFVLTLTRPSEANFWRYEVVIKGAVGGPPYLTDYSLVDRYVLTVAQNAQLAGYDPSLTAVVRAQSWAGFFSSTATDSATLTPPATPSGLTSSWAGDTGTAGPDCAISWTAAAGLRYTLTTDSVARILGTTDHYTYTLDTNRSDHAGTPDPALSLSLVAIDALGQISAAPATLTATNAAPAAPSVTLADGFGFIGGRVTSSPPADFAIYEYVWKLAGVAQLTLESSSSEQQYEAPVNGTWTLAVRVKDSFGQPSSATTSASVVHEALTITSLRAGASYTDDLGTSPTLLAALKDGNTTSGGITYS